MRRRIVGARVDGLDLADVGDNAGEHSNALDARSSRRQAYRCPAASVSGMRQRRRAAGPRAHRYHRRRWSAPPATAPLHRQDRHCTNDAATLGPPSTISRVMPRSASSRNATADQSEPPSAPRCGSPRRPGLRRDCSHGGRIRRGKTQTGVSRAVAVDRSQAAAADARSSMTRTGERFAHAGQAGRSAADRPTAAVPMPTRIASCRRASDARARAPLRR